VSGLVQGTARPKRQVYECRCHKRHANRW